MTRLAAAACIAICVIALQAGARVIDPCTMGILVESKGEIVIAVTLLHARSSDLNVPILGANDVNRLSVDARIDRIRKGAFPHREGSRVRLAIHSIARTFGSDYHGERYDIGLERDGDDGYAIVSIAPEISTTVQFRGTIVGGTPADPERRIEFDRDGPTVRVRVESNEIVTLRLPVGENRKLQLGQPICVFALHRAARKDRPYRLLRLTY